MKNNKSLGQHWLKNRAILDEIAELLDAPASALCIEIGPGLGTLTSSLLKRFNKVLAIEYDARLAANLPGSFPGKNLEVLNTDILDFDFDSIKENYVVAGNIPYYITSPIIEKLLTTQNPASKIVLLIQKEVAERIASDKETVLSLMVKNFADVELGPVVKREEFTPPPKVDSQVIILAPHAPTAQPAVLDFIKKAFASPRKKLTHNLASLKTKPELVKILKDLGLNENSRPADLHLSDYTNLYRKLNP